MGSPEPRQYKNDAVAYALIDEFLTSLKGAEPNELITHLILQTEAYKIYPSGPTLKAITTIRVLIEEQGADPDELIEKRKREGV